MCLFIWEVVRMKGVEPPHHSILDPKSSASANSATSAQCSVTQTSKASVCNVLNYNNKWRHWCQDFFNLFLLFFYFHAYKFRRSPLTNPINVTPCFRARWTLPFVGAEMDKTQRIPFWMIQVITSLGILPVVKSILFSGVIRFSKIPPNSLL